MLPRCKAAVNWGNGPALFGPWLDRAPAHTGRMASDRPPVAVTELLVVAPPAAQTWSLVDALVMPGCVLLRADGPCTMQALLAARTPQALVFDGPCALEGLRRLRERSRLPALVLLPPGPAAERVIALESGADQVLTHPVLPRELLARLRAVLRRAPSPPAQERFVPFGGWRLDRLTRQLQGPAGVCVALSPAECRLLLTFLQRPGSVIARDELMDLARGRSIEAFERSIDLLVSRLRGKLADDPRAPRYIRTVRGVGYLFDRFGLEADAPRPDAAAVFPVRYQGDKAA